MPRVNTGEFHPIVEEITNSHLAITSELVNPFLIVDGHPNNDNIAAASNYICYNSPVYAATHCKCCGLTMHSFDYIETDICDRCKELIAKEVFDSKNQFTTCNNIINIIRGKIIDAV